MGLRIFENNPQPHSSHIIMKQIDMNPVKHKVDALRDASIKIILENQASSGAYIASPNFPVYNYCWFRDGSFIADAMSVSGELESAVRFHGWATKVINGQVLVIKGLLEKQENGIAIQPEEHLHCRFTVDGKESAEDWTNFQLDGFGTWLWSLDEFSKRGFQLSRATLEAANLLIPYLSTFWREPSFDWWEESFGYQHVSTLVAIATGLERCAHWDQLSDEARNLAFEASNEIRAYVLENGVHHSRLSKWVGSDSLDGSLSACISPFHFFQPGSALANATLESVASELKVYGTYRHKRDVYYGGGSWIILSAFLGLGFAESGELERAEKILSWITHIANERNEIPEQLNDHLLFPAFESEWIAKWGAPAVPLLWSHAMFLKLLAVIENLGGPHYVNS